MRCASCQHDNPPRAKFCLNCGTPFVRRTCAACGTEIPPAAKFCLECGVAVAGAPADGAPADPAPATPPDAAAPAAGRTREHERRQVTVLFADVVDFTGLAERLDPERVHGIMDRCVRLLVDEVRRYEGTVNQFTGDGIMALFGAPVAREHAPERAVRAALDMQTALARYREELHRADGIDFQMRIGVHTGPVVVGSVGDDADGDYTALGDTTNLAARLQGAAAPGTVLVSEATARLVSGRFAMRPVGPLALKGRSNPIAAFEVSRVLPRAPLLPVSAAGLTPLVGRDAEIAALESLAGRARGGAGHLVFVVGEAGIGKSRLIHELQGRLRDQKLSWLVGRCVSFGRAIPFLPVIDLVKGGFGIEEGDGEAAIVEKVRAGLAALGADPAAEPYVRALLAVDPGEPAVAAMDAGARRFAIFEALKRLTLVSAARQPIVILVEDLHWIDQASEQYLTYLVDALASAPVLLLCTFRPPYRPPFADRSYITRLALQPLSPEETATMAGRLLAAEDFPEEIRALIAAKAEGNPFFIEEVTKSLVEMGALVRTDDGYALGRPVSEIVIPDTIQDVIMARIDRLGEAPKRAIQIASVIGREFAVRLLQRAADLGDRVNALVGELRALELIYEKSGVPELAYMFKHALTHDVAYESLLVERRKELHRIIGLATEELYADRLAEHYETLAYHFDRAELWPRAFAYLVKAGHKARAGFANREAVRFYMRALELAEHVEVPPAERLRILEGAGRARFGLSEFPEARDAFAGALALAEDEADRGRLQVALADALLWAHELDAAIRAAEEGHDIGLRLDDPLSCGTATSLIGFVHMLRGDLERAESCYATATATLRRTGRSDRQAEARAFHAMVLSWRGSYATALAEMESIIDDFQHENELLNLAMAYSNFTVALGSAGAYARALACAERGVALGEAIGDRVWRARTWNTRGWILAELGHFDAAEEANRRCLELAAQLGSLDIVSELIGNAAANLADVALGRGDPGGAEPHLAEVAALVANPRNEWMVWRYRMHYELTAAELALARGDLAAARHLIGSCLAVAGRTRSRRYLVRATRLLAECHVAAGRLPEAERLLAGAVADARALGNPPQLWQTLAAYGRVLDAEGKRDQAVAAWREAAATMAATETALPEELRAVFGTSPIRHALAAAGA